jgi:hypothetical protein
MRGICVIPRFFREDSDEILSNPELAAAVPLWMNIAAQVSVGSRDLVPKNGPVVSNSSDEDSPTEEHGDKLTGMYTEGLKAPIHLSQQEAARQKAAVAYAKSQGYGKWISSDSNASGFEGESSDFDVPRSQSVHSSPAPSMGWSEIETSVLSDTSESEALPAPKRKGSGKKGSGKKAATRPAGSPMVTCSQDGCRAGGIRGVGGSGQTDTCVAHGNPSKT